MEFLSARADRTFPVAPNPRPTAAPRCPNNLQVLEKLYESPGNTNLIVSMATSPSPLAGEGWGGAARTVPAGPPPPPPPPPPGGGGGGGGGGRTPPPHKRQ